MSRLIRVKPKELKDTLLKKEVDIVLTNNDVHHGYLIKIDVDKINLKPLIGKTLTFSITDISEIVYRD